MEQSGGGLIAILSCQAQARCEERERERDIYRERESPETQIHMAFLRASRICGALYNVWFKIRCVFAGGYESLDPQLAFTEGCLLRRGLHNLEDHWVLGI